MNFQRLASQSSIACCARSRNFACFTTSFCRLNQDDITRIVDQATVITSNVKTFTVEARLASLMTIAVIPIAFIARSYNGTVFYEKQISCRHGHFMLAVILRASPPFFFSCGHVRGSNTYRAHDRRPIFASLPIIRFTRQLSRESSLHSR